ncbi:MAG: hypothetical protein V7731_08230 [Amphritea sp.]
MGYHLFRFMLSLLLPEWMQNRQPDMHHFYRRKFTTQYLAKKKRVVWLWVAAGCLMLLIPLPAFIIGTSLLMTFISFSLLDETS